MLHVKCDACRTTIERTRARLDARGRLKCRVCFERMTFNYALFFDRLVLAAQIAGRRGESLSRATGISIAVLHNWAKGHTKVPQQRLYDRLIAYLNAASSSKRRDP